MTKQKKFFNALLAFSPILSMYSLFGIQGISILDGLLFIFLLSNFKVIKNYFLNRLNYSSPGMLFILYIIVQFIIFSIFRYDIHTTISISLRTGRILYYLISMFVFFHDYFNFKDFIKYLKILVIFSTVFFFIQIIVLRVFDFYIKGYLPYPPQLRQELVDFSNNAWNAPHVRVRSIFGEISQFSIVCGAYLFSTINDVKSLFQKNKRCSLYLNIVILFALSITISNVAYFVILFYLISLIFMSVDFKKIQISKRVMVNIIIVFLVIILALIGSGIYQKITDRFLYSFMNRFSSYLSIFTGKDLNNKFDLIFGVGMNSSNFSVWYPSIPRIFAYFGIVGLTIFLTFVFEHFSKLNMKGKIFTIFIFFMSLATEIMVGNFILIFVPLMSHNYLVNTDVIKNQIMM